MSTLNVNTLVGKTLQSVTRKGDESITFKVSDGESYIMHHNQDCCENVEIESIAGDLQDLVGTPIVMAEESTKKGDDKGYDSSTWTFYRFRTIKGDVDIRWYGSSNGYYSESVDFERIEAEIKREPIKVPTLDLGVFQKSLHFVMQNARGNQRSITLSAASDGACIESAIRYAKENNFNSLYQIVEIKM